MFTGLIEETGKIKSVEKASNGTELTIASNLIAKECSIGDSVSLNGVCSTVMKKSGNSFSVEFSNHTLELTTFKNAKVGDILNLERAMKLSDRLNGHLVSGHVDGTAVVAAISDGEFTFSADAKLMKYIVFKGSVAVNGISLTVSEIGEAAFSVEIIPHTLLHTNLKNLKVGAHVNIETDLIGKYIEKFLLTNDNVSNMKDCRSINEQFLYEKGFL